MPLFDQYTERFRNNSGNEIPAFGVVHITDSEFTNNDLVYVVEAAQSENFPLNGALLINGPVAVADGKLGEGMFAIRPALIAYDNGDGTPARGEFWGLDNDAAKFKLRKDSSTVEFIVISDPVDEPTDTVMALPVPEGYVIEGLLTTTLAAATDFMDGPATATGRIYVKDPATGDMIPGDAVTLTSRDPDLEGVDSAYFQARRLNGEWRPFWVACSANATTTATV